MRSVLIVGANETQTEKIRRLPITVLSSKTAAKGASLLCRFNFDLVISRWNLADMPEGQFLLRIHEAKPSVALIAITDAGDCLQEIQARSLGVSAVVSETDGQQLTELLSGLLGIIPQQSIFLMGSSS